MTTPAGTGEEQNATVAGEETFTAFAKALGQASPTIRAKIAQQLKDAGIYRGKVTGEFNNRFYDALIEAEKRRSELARVIDVPNRFDFIASLALEGEGSGKEGPSRVTSRTISEPKELFDDIDAVTREFLGRELPDAAKKKLAKKYIARQKAGKLDVTTTYSEDGSFRQTTGGGVTPQQFFIEEISETDEAKANKALRGYEILDGILGGLR